MLAEMIFALFIIEHNIPIACIEPAGTLFCAMIPKYYASVQTKTISPIKSMVHFAQNGIIDHFKNNLCKLDTSPKNIFFFFI